jgi:hypothetical protein
MQGSISSICAERSLAGYRHAAGTSLMARRVVGGPGLEMTRPCAAHFVPWSRAGALSLATGKRLAADLVDGGTPYRSELLASQTDTKSNTRLKQLDAMFYGTRI